MIIFFTHCHIFQRLIFFMILMAKIKVFWFLKSVLLNDIKIFHSFFTMLRKYNIFLLLLIWERNLNTLVVSTYLKIQSY